MLNPDSVRSFTPLGSHRAAKNTLFLTALANYTLQQIAKAEEAARSRAEAARALEEAIEQDEDNEQFLLVPPEEYDDLLTEYIDFNALASGIAERQANAYNEMDDDDYY